MNCTGVNTGNADIEDSSQWSPPQSPPERPRLPGHEHDVDWDDLPLADIPVPRAPRGIL